MPSYTVVVVRILAVSCNIIGSTMATLAQIKVCGRHYGAVAASQGHRDTPNPSESFVCVPEGWMEASEAVDWPPYGTPLTHTSVQAGPTGSS